MSVLKMQNISKHFGNTYALKNVSFDVKAGEVRALIGENGAGKSTLMKILSGALIPDSGEMYINGKEYRPRSPYDGKKFGIGMIYQELSLIPDLTAAENIVLGNEPCFGPFLKLNDIKKIADSSLKSVNLSDLPRDVPVKKFSNAQRQLIEIAKNLTAGAKILIFDEPTSSLSHKDVETLFQLIKRLKSENYTVIYISHILEEVKEVCDTFTILRDGESVATGNMSDVSLEYIVKMMVARDVKEFYPHTDRMKGEKLLEISRLSGFDMPQDVSITLYRGEVIGIAGVVGAGRTEFFRCLFGLAPIKSGEIKIGIIKGKGRYTDTGELWDAGVGMVSEDRKNEGLFMRLSISDNITMPKLPFFISPKRQAERCKPFIRELGIKCESVRMHVENLSGGNQQKVAIARLLHADVDIFLLDEPTRGIDIGSKVEIYRLIDSLVSSTYNRNSQAKAVIMISSYLPELLGVCDRIAVMTKGKLGELTRTRPGPQI